MALPMALDFKRGFSSSAKTISRAPLQLPAKGEKIIPKINDNRIKLVNTAGVIFQFLNFINNLP
jgi:hypothetical protein